MSTTMRVLLDIGDTFTWTSTVAMIAFLVQYSLLAPWWKNFVGRSIVFLDLAILGLLIPSCIELAKPHWKPFFASTWFIAIEVVILMVCTFVPLTRIYSFTRVNRLQFKREGVVGEGSNEPVVVTYDVKDLIDDLTERVAKLESEQHDEDHNKKLALAWITVGGSIIFTISAAVGIVQWLQH